MSAAARRYSNEQKRYEFDDMKRALSELKAEANMINAHLAQRRRSHRKTRSARSRLLRQRGSFFAEKYDSGKYHQARKTFKRQQARHRQSRRRPRLTANALARAEAARVTAGENLGQTRGDSRRRRTDFEML